MATYDYLIVGCGFAGATLAERIARELDKRVLIIDRRSHVGGICHDFLTTEGLLVSSFGAHIFHTSIPAVWEYVNRFGTFNTYIHRVEAKVDGRFFPMPINLDTINSFFGVSLLPEEVPSFLEKKRVPIAEPRNAEEAVISRIGWELYDAFYRNYTRKQWGMEAAELDASVTMRLPIRNTTDSRYFSDTWQGLPLKGYTAMFEAMLSHPNITLQLNTDYKEVVDVVSFNRMIFTGPVDAFFDYSFGRLPYRSIEFRFETIRQPEYQHIGVINYPNDFDYTRCVEYKHLYRRQGMATTISREYPCWNDDEPYYPVPSPANRELYGKYRNLSSGIRNVLFCGRLGTYQYLNMDQCVAQALDLFGTKIAG